MAVTVVEFLLESFKELLLEVHRQITADPWSMTRSEVREMEGEVEQLKAFLHDAAKGEGEEGLSEIEGQTRDVVHDAEEIIETFLIHVTAKAPTNVSRRLHNRKRGFRLAKELISFRKDRLAPVLRRVGETNDVNQMGQGSGIMRPEIRPTKEKEAKVPSIRLSDIVGFEDEAEILIDYLKEEAKELDVIAITGMPGIGKTTLARKIYQDEKIKEEFPTRIWVDVPHQRFHWRNILLVILEEITKRHMSSMDDQDLINEVCAHLQNRKFLLVMDAVWTADSWKKILNFLPKMGKILITSRNNNICMHANVTRQPHMLRFLNERESWELLQLVVFGGLNRCPESLKSVGQCIANKCDGLPLAIKVIGSSLVVGSSTRTAEGLTAKLWQKVSEDLTTYVKDYEQQRVLGIVALSYNKLPVQLRDCFLYCGVFPEDYEIPVKTLIRLWIAEGFIQDNEGQSNLEKIAEQNLDDLINQNLVMVGKVYSKGKVKTCRLHKVIHGFCKSKAAELNFFQEIKRFKKGVFDPPIPLSPNCRRLCINSDLPDFLSRKPNGPGVRSFLWFDKDPIILDPQYISVFPKSFNLLRVLESKTIKFSEFPVKLTKLIYLRYMSLSCDNLNVLPETISDLWNLQVLIVDTQSPSIEIKANIWKMSQLRHLITKAAIVLAIKGKGGAGENLQTLSRLSPEYCREDVFRRARNLKTLGIRGQLTALLEAGPLRMLNLLENLKLVNDLLHESASANQLYRLLSLNFPPNLKRLTLSATYLNWEHMSILGKIDTLEILKLKDNAFTGESWSTDADGFSRLEFLFIGNTDLASWEASAGCFPRLKCLVLRNCEKLRKIPLSLAKSLEILDVEHVAKSAVESAREIEEEKVRLMLHVEHVAKSAVESDKEIEEEKERLQGKQKGRSGEFKLFIGPGCK